MRVVLNQCYGGFDLSQKALEWLVDKGWKFTTFNENDLPINPQAELLYKPIGSTFGNIPEGNLAINWWKYDQSDVPFRSNPEIISVVEELKEESFGRGSKLNVEEVDDDYFWEIKSHDGMESLYGKEKVYA